MTIREVRLYLIGFVFLYVFVYTDPALLFFIYLCPGITLVYIASFTVIFDWKGVLRTNASSSESAGDSISVFSLRGGRCLSA